MSLQNLKDVLADLIPKEQNRIKNFKQQYGKTNIGQITVDMVSHFSVGSMCNRFRPKCVGSDEIRLITLCTPQVYGGMRGMKGLVYETSVLDPDEVSV